MSEDFRIPCKQLCLCSAAALSLFLGGCSNDFGPFSMPSGYAHHNKEYKAPPGAELLAVPDEKADEANESDMEMVAVPPEDVTEDPVAAMDFTTTPEDYVHESPVSRPDPAEDRRKDSVKRTGSGVVAGAGDDYEINAYESYVEKTYVYDKSYEERRLRAAAARAEQAGRKSAAGAGGEAAHTVPSSGHAAPDADMDAVAGELLDRLVRDFGKPVEPVYLEQAGADNPALPALRQALQAAMEAEDFTVTDKAGRGPFIMKYGIDRVADEPDMALVTLTMMSGKTLAAQVSETYPLAKTDMVDDMAPIGNAMPETPRYEPDPGVSYPPDSASGEPVSLFEP